MLKGIIFDFDGVICESVEAKTEAFRKVFLDHANHWDEIYAYHMKHGGISRYKKFEYIFREILKKPLSSELSEQMAQKFTEFAYDEVVKAPLVKGAQEFLNKYSKTLKLFVASGTPETEMVMIAKEKDLDRFFVEVYGSPKTKYEIAALILQQEKLKPEEVIFVGDAISDYEGAHQAGIRFIGRLHAKYKDPFQDEKIEGYINDLNDLDHLITTKFK